VTRGRLIALVLVGTIAVLTAVRVFVAPVRAGPVVFEVEDATGVITTVQARLRGQRWQPQVTVGPGRHELVVEWASTWDGVRSAVPYEVRRLWVLPWSTERVRTVRLSYDVKLGSPAVPHHAIRSSDQVEVHVLLPDGGVLPNADVMCGDSKPQVADEQGTAWCSAGPDAFRVWVGNAELGRHAEVGPRTTAIELTTTPGMEVRTTLPGPGTVELSFWSKADTVFGPSGPGPHLFPGLPAMRTIVCALERDDVGACDVVVPDGGVVDASLPVGPSGTLTFAPNLDGGLVVYVDRRSREPATSLQLVPGKHVLVLNERGSERRYEAVVNVTSGATTDLGAVELK